MGDNGTRQYGEYRGADTMQPTISVRCGCRDHFVFHVVEVDGLLMATRVELMDITYLAVFIAETP